MKLLTLLALGIAAQAADIGKWKVETTMDRSGVQSMTASVDSEVETGEVKEQQRLVVESKAGQFKAFIILGPKSDADWIWVGLQFDDYPATFVTGWKTRMEGRQITAPEPDFIWNTARAHDLVVQVRRNKKPAEQIHFDVHGLDNVLGRDADRLRDLVDGVRVSGPKTIAPPSIAKPPAAPPADRVASNATPAPSTPVARPLTAATAGIVLDVKNTAAKRSVVNDFVTDYGSYDKTYTRERTIEISVHALSKTPVPTACRVFWIGKRGVGNDRLILGESVAGYTENNAPHVFQESSGQFESTDLNLNAIGVRRTGGERIEGWAVLIENPDTGDLLTAKCSDPYLDSLLRTGDLERLGRGPLAKFMPKPLSAGMAKVKEHPRLLPGNAMGN